MKINKTDIAFLIRAYNEASRIWSVLDQILKAGYKKILVVNDGSKDDTLKVLEGYPNVIVISHQHNRGGGAALETGFEFFRRSGEELEVKYVVTFDADGQHTIKDLPNFIEAFEKDPTIDIVFGSRFITKTDTNVPLTRRLVLFGGRIFTWMISGIRLTDSHNGYRVISLEALKKIVLTMDGMEYASELIEQVRLKKLKFKEVPVNIHYDSYTLGKGQRYGGVWRIVTKIIWKKFFS